MRRLGLTCLLAATPAVAQAAIDNAALECGSDAGNNTYFPRGDHWAMTPPIDANAVLFRQQYQGAPTISDGSDLVAMHRAFATWMLTPCAGGLAPNILIDDAFARIDQADYDSRDRGDTYRCPGGGVCGEACQTNECDIISTQNILYFVVSNWAAIADPLTVALTTNLYIPDTDMIVTADMELNAVDFQWRTDSGGCSGNTCYHVETVALHEAGHFIGFNHVQCADAIMFPQGAGTEVKTLLSNHEIAALCTVYAPRDPSLPDPTVDPNARDRMEQCSSTTQCQGSDICIKPFGLAADSPWGWCAEPCTTTTDCDTAFVCVQQDGGTQKFCRPGVHDTGGSVIGGGTVDPITGEAIDLCAPCTAGDQCSSGVCISEGGSDGICTRTCVGGALPGGDTIETCPTGMMCIPTQQGGNVCWPESATSCGTPAARGELNSECYRENDPSNQADDWFFACGPELICFGFKARSEGQIGACVQYCNASDRPCRDGNMACCFGVDDLGACLGPSAGVHGGCFDIRRAGESCVTAEQSICESGTSCFYFDDPALSKCYTLCSSNSSCHDSESCMSYPDGNNNQFSLCCAASELPACLPSDEIFFFDVGVACRLNDECDSKLCLNFDGQAACSRWCNPVTGSGCPGDIDVNGDGITDGGFRCLLIAGQGRCWPLTGPADPPANAHRGVDPPGGCCESAAVRPGDMFLMALLFSPLFVRRLRCRRRQGLAKTGVGSI
ncbi:MAG: matrixin family metalloprotease [Myxococcota bacterium]